MYDGNILYLHYDKQMCARVRVRMCV